MKLEVIGLFCGSMAFYEDEDDEDDVCIFPVGNPLLGESKKELCLVLVGSVNKSKFNQPIGAYHDIPIQI